MKPFKQHIWLGRLLLTALAALLVAGAGLGIRAIGRSFVEEVTVEASFAPSSSRNALSAGYGAAEKSEAAPNFILQDTKGTSVDLGMLRRKPVVLVFFSGWNERSLDAVRMLDAAYSRLSNEQVSAFAVDNLESAVQARDLAERSGMSLPILMDSEGTTGESYRLSTLPMFFFIGRDGILKERVIGVISKDAIIAKALELKER